MKALAEKKIVFFIYCGAASGGLERRFVRLATYLKSSNVDVELCCTVDFFDSLSEMGISFPRVQTFFIERPTGPDSFFIKVKRLWGLLKAFNALRNRNIAQVHLAMNPGLVSSLYAFLSKWLPSYSFSVVDPIRSFNVTALNRTAKAVVAIDCLSNGIATYVRDSMRVNYPHPPIKISPCSFTDYSLIKHSSVRDIDVLMVARFSEEKGHELLSRTASNLSDLQVHVCGEGPYIPPIAGAKIYHVKNSFDVLSRAKIFLSIQRVENYPSQSLLEAMASGCAIIATDVGETRRLLDETCAILINSDPVELHRAIRRLTLDDQLRERLGTAAKIRATSQHSIEKFAKYFMSEIVFCDP